MKKNILKVFAVLLVLVMFSVFASCGGNDTDKGKDSTETEDTSSAYIGGSDKLGSAKPGGKDPGKPSGESEKSSGGNTSETSKPQRNNYTSGGGMQEETASAAEPEEKDNEGEFVIPSREIQLPIVPIE